VERPAPRTAANIGLGGGAGVFYGVLPSAALALQLQAAYVSGLFSLRVRGTLLWPQQQHIAEGNVRWHDYELSVEGCAGFPFSEAPRLVLRACAGPRGGIVHVSAHDFALQNQAASKFLMYLGVMPELTLALGARTQLQLGAAASLGLVRPRFGIGLNNGAQLATFSTPGWLRGEVALSLLQIF
jgi:hypothetical protein